MPSRKSVSAEACNCWISLSARDSALFSCRIVPLSRLDFETAADTVRRAERDLAGDSARDLEGLRPRPSLRGFGVAPRRPPALLLSAFFFMGPSVEARR